MWGILSSWLGLFQEERHQTVFGKKRCFFFLSQHHFCIDHSIDLQLMVM